MKKLLQTFLLQTVIYGISVWIYYFVVLQHLGDWLNQLFHSNLVLYAVLSLVFVILQSIFLDTIIKFLLRHLRFERVE
jgi:hypothetical protein